MSCFFCEMWFCFVRGSLKKKRKFSLTRWHMQPSYSLTNPYSTFSSHSEDVSFTLCDNCLWNSFDKSSEILKWSLLNASYVLCLWVIVNVVLTHNNRHAAVCWPLHIFTSRVFTPFVGGCSENVGWSWKSGMNTHEYEVSYIYLLHNPYDTWVKVHKDTFLYQQNICFEGKSWWVY